ncbi:MAG: hypothetical protein KGJ57_05545 [Sphingomonadales bacterium]|nr:hypothetical protein [Sphingomonadales bacterium]MDE2168881.1 hypothetical protein [Sphingomonadales bacterium]
MKAERDKLKRLQRLEKLRGIAKQAAATEAARAESTLAQLTMLVERTRALRNDYAARTDMTDGAEVSRMVRFVAGLQGIAETTAADMRRAEHLADRRQSELAAAERRRAAVEERAVEQARAMAAKAQYSAFSAQSFAPSGGLSGSRGKTGTEPA